MHPAALQRVCLVKRNTYCVAVHYYFPIGLRFFPFTWKSGMGGEEEKTEPEATDVSVRRQRAREVPVMNISPVRQGKGKTPDITSSENINFWCYLIGC